VAATPKTNGVCGKQSAPVDAFVIHHLEASLSVGSQLKKILATHFRNEPQWITTSRRIVACAVAILKPRDAGHNFTQRRLQVTQPNVLWLKHMRIGVNNFLCPRHCLPPSFCKIAGWL